MASVLCQYIIRKLQTICVDLYLNKTMETKELGIFEKLGLTGISGQIQLCKAGKLGNTPNNNDDTSQYNSQFCRTLQQYTNITRQTEGGVGLENKTVFPNSVLHKTTLY